MIISKYVTCRGRKIPVAELKPNSEIKVLVECPTCKKQRMAFYKVARKTQVCQVCGTRKSHLKKVKKGTKYNRLTYVGTKSGKHIWECDCGNRIKAKVCTVKSGGTKSCGCLRSELASELGKKIIGKWVGKNHPNWKGGRTSERERFNTSKKAKEWRVSVFERDDYTCQHCGQIGGELNAHHIKQWALHPKERLNIDNGLTLCKECHIKEHKRVGKYKSKHRNNIEV